MRRVGLRAGQRRRCCTQLRAQGQGAGLKGAMKRDPWHQHLWAWLRGWMLERKYFTEGTDQGWISILLQGRILPVYLGCRSPAPSLHGDLGG